MERLSERHRRILKLGVRGGADDDLPGLGDALDRVGQQVQDRIGREGADYTPGTDPSDLGNGAGGQGQPGAAPTPPAAPQGQPPAPPRAPDPNQLPDNAPYRDAAALRAEMARYRDTYQPFEQAFGGLDQQQRQAFLEAAPQLGPDLGLVARSMAGLHPDDRAYFLDVFNLMATNPAEAAERLANGAEALRRAGGAPPAPNGQGSSDELEWVQPGASEPVTGADFQEWFDREWSKRTAEADQQRMFEKIDADLEALGYNLSTQDPAESARIQAVLEYARRTDGNLANADRALKEAWQQSTIDNFVDEQRQEAGRRPSPTGEGAGAPPSGEKELESMDDAEQAMFARLESAGVTGRRRSL